MIPLNINSWIQQNANLLKPPVNNFCLWREKDLTVMVVGGPNKRTDYHINPTEEFFYQHLGDMELGVVNTCEKTGNNLFETIHIRQGELFVLPAGVPHNPCRFENTVGLVIEVSRPQGKLDSLRWYCEQCKEIVYEQSFYCVDLGKQLKPVIDEYFANQDLRTCKKCNHVNKAM